MTMRKQKAKAMTDVEFAQDPMLWPKWPVLPLCKRGSSHDDEEGTGFLTAFDRKRVYFGNIYDTPNVAKAHGCKTWAEVLVHYKSKTFPDLETIVRLYRID